MKKFILTFITLIGVLPALSACSKIWTGGSTTKDDSANNQSASEPLFVALTQETSTDTFGLAISSGDGLAGTIFCVTTVNAVNTAADCEVGKGAFHTTDYVGVKNGRRFFHANLPLAVAAGKRITVVGHDASGIKIVSTTVEFQKK